MRGKYRCGGDKCVHEVEQHLASSEVTRTNVSLLHMYTSGST